MELTVAELAALCHKGVRRLRQINDELPEDKKILAKGPGGKYDLALFIERWVDYHVGKSGKGELKLDEIKAQHEIVKMQKTQMSVDMMTSSLLDADEVKAGWQKIVMGIRASLLSLGGVLGPRLTNRDSPLEIQNMIDRDVKSMLKMLAGKEDKNHHDS